MDLAKRLGLTRGRVRIARQRYLQEGEGWTRKGNKILLTHAGVEKLLGVFQVSQEEVPETEYVDLVVVRFWTNPRLLGCVYAKDYQAAELRNYLPAKLVNLTVRETKNFKRGMLVPAKKHPGELRTGGCKKAGETENTGKKHPGGGGTLTNYRVYQQTWPGLRETRLWPRLETYTKVY